MNQELGTKRKRKLSRRSLKYFAEWGEASRALRAKNGWTAKEADAFRHTLHIRALGYDKSSKKLTNTEFDKVIAIFRAVANPDDIAGQVEALDQPMVRAAHALKDVLNKIKLDDYIVEQALSDKARQLRREPTPAEEQAIYDELRTNYVNAISRKINKKPVSRCNDKELTKLIAALKIHLNR